MKKIVSIFLLSLLLAPAIYSQDNQEVKKNEFRLELLNFIGSTFYAEYERSISETKGLNFVIAPTAIENTEKSHFGILFQINPKLYYNIGKSKNSVQRLYFSPYANYRYLDISNENNYTGYWTPPYNEPTSYNFIASSAGLGMLIGFKVEAGNFFVFNIEAGGGPRYVFEKGGNATYNEVNEGFNNWNLGYSGIFPRFNMTMGFKF